MTEEKNIIKEIILYPDRAYVTRIENPELKKGKVDFIFHHLPPQIIKDSLNVKILGKFHAKIEGIDLKEEMLEEYSNEDIRKIYACLDDQENELKKIQDKLVQLNKQEELLKNVQKINNINLMNEFYNKISDINEFNNLLNFFSTNLNNINDDMLVLITNKNKIEAKINTLRSELENKKNSRYKKHISFY